MEGWTIVFRAVYTNDVYMAQSILEDEGIATIISDEYNTQTGIHAQAIGGAKLSVEDKNYERAYGILRDAGYIRNEPENRDSGMIVDVQDKTHCPFCNSTDIEKQKNSNCLYAVVYYILGVFVPAFRESYHCKNCHTSWRFKK